MHPVRHDARPPQPFPRRTLRMFCSSVSDTAKCVASLLSMRMLFASKTVLRERPGTWPHDRPHPPVSMPDQPPLLPPPTAARAVPEHARRGALVLVGQGTVAAHDLHAVAGLDAGFGRSPSWRATTHGTRVSGHSHGRAWTRPRPPARPTAFSRGALARTHRSTRSSSTTTSTERGSWPAGAFSGISWIDSVWWSWYIDRPYSVTSGLPASSWRRRAASGRTTPVGCAVSRTRRVGAGTERRRCRPRRGSWAHEPRLGRPTS